MRSIIAISCVLMVLGCQISSSFAQYSDPYYNGGGYGGQDGYQDYNYYPENPAYAQGVGTWVGKALKPASTFLYKGLQGMVEGFGNQAGQAAGEAVFRGNQDQNNQG